MWPWNNSSTKGHGRVPLPFLQIFGKTFCQDLRARQFLKLTDNVTRNQNFLLFPSRQFAVRECYGYELGRHSSLHVQKYNIQECCEASFRDPRKIFWMHLSIEQFPNKNSTARPFITPKTSATQDTKTLQWLPLSERSCHLIFILVSAGWSRFMNTNSMARGIGGPVLDLP